MQAETLGGELEHPWGLDFLPDGDAIVTERPGRLRILSGGELSAPVSGVPQVAAAGQGGLLDIAASPDFASSGLIYFSFSEPGDGGAGTAVARARLVRDGDAPRLEGLEVIFSMERKTGTSHHFGSRLVFHPDGTLFVTTGDRGDGSRAQDFQDHAGAVLRINPDGTIPDDNPYADGAGGKPEIWSKGHRNLQGATFDPVTNSRADGRARRQGRRRGQPAGSRQELRLAGDQLWRQLFRQQDRRRHRGAGIRAAALLLGPVDRALGDGGL